MDGSEKIWMEGRREGEGARKGERFFHISHTLVYIYTQPPSWVWMKPGTQNLIWDFLWVTEI